MPSGLDDAFREVLQPLADKMDALLHEIRSRMGERRPAQAAAPSNADVNAPLTRQQAAAELGRHPRTISRWIKEGKLRPTSPGGRWISRFEINRFLSVGKDGGGEDVEAVVARLLKK